MELMVALVIGLFGVLIMVQVYSLAENNKRTSSSGNDAMNEGISNLYALQRDVSMGGFGIADTKLLGCNTVLRSGVTLVAMAPVTINHPSIPAGDANTDTVLIVSAYSNGSTQGDSITASAGSDQYTVNTPASFSVNDWVIPTPLVRTCSGTASSLTPALALTQIAATTSTSVSVTSGTGTVLPSYLSPYPTLFNLGPKPPKVIAYAVRSGNLTVCDYIANDCSIAANVANASIWVPVGSNIVSLRAQYGRDSTAGNMDGVVDVYDQTQPASACDWARVSAIRIALVSRSVQPAAGVTSTAPVWDGSSTNPISLSGNAAWQNYRYRVFQTLVPLRNIAWMMPVAGC